MSVETAVKIPIDGERPLLSTGTHRLRIAGCPCGGWVNGMHCTWISPRCITPAKTCPPSIESQVIPTIVIGWERQMSRAHEPEPAGLRQHERLQACADRISTNCSADKFQLSLGVRHRFDCCLVSFGVTENLQNLNNTPDIGFQIGFAWVPRLKPQSKP